MIKSPPTAGNFAMLKLWASDVFRAGELTPDDSIAIQDIEDAFHDAEDPRTKGLLEGVLLFIRSLQGDAWAGAPQQADAEDQDLASGSVDMQTKILRRLVESPEGVRPSEIAASLGVTPEHVSRVLRRLVDEGLARKAETQPQDSRGVWYVATGDGREALRLIDEDASLGPVQALDRLVAEHKRKVIGALISEQRGDRRAERATADFVDRPLLAFQMAKEINDDRLYLEAAAEYLTSLRHRNRGGDKEEAARFLAGLKQTAPVGADDAAAECHRAALWAYETAKLFEPSPAECGRLFTEAEDALTRSGRDRSADLGVWVANARGVLALGDGRYITARDHAELARERARQRKDWFAEVTVGARLAMILRLSGQAGVAARQLDHLLDVMDGADLGGEFELLRAECLYQRGEARRWQGNKKKASADLMAAVALLDGANAEGSRQFSFTRSAVAALAYDLAQSRSPRAHLDRDTEKELREVLAQAGNDLDLQALTTRRLAVVLRESDARASYKEAMKAHEMYQGLSAVGEIESLVCAAGVSGSPKEELRRILPLLEVLEQQAERPAAGQAPRLKLLDVWTIRSVESIGDKQGVLAESGDIKQSWQVLADCGLVATQGSELGESMMGKEPLLMAA